MAGTSQDAKAIFAGAIEKKTPEERAAYLDAACGSDSQLRAEIESLVAAHCEDERFLRVLIEDQEAIEVAPLTESPGTVIDRYKLLERIGEGGMAVVYMAEQEQPIRRKVALKVIKLGMDTRQVIARFEAERQALALMDHPSIAKVLDAGATETGRPYFVMELVQGVSITDYCDRNNLSTRDRLALFIQVCNAVQHAHQKGIIHRDIKPSNVMVAHHDGQPVPKVIDFGIAKATNQRLTEKTLFTRYAHIIGTPAYMSPEQAELSDLDIDTRTDIYSLGVLLYELLTGTTPFGEEELRKAGYIEMQRVIREQEPARPSTKLRTLGETLTDIAKHRNSTPDLLRKAVRGDLDWIVMKSLEKDRARRYETASALAEDVRRHLEHEPVLARSPGTAYRLRKFLRRHRVPTLVGAVLAVVGGIVIVILSMWNRDRVQLAEAEGFKHRGILSQAREQYARADRDGATETIRPILHSKHVGSEAQLLQATILVDNRRSEEAVTILGSLLNEKPEVAGAAHSLLARILWESESPNADKLKEIEEHRQKAEALLPETAEAYFLRAMTAVTVKEQLAALDRALQLDPAHYESRRLRAFTYYASRKYDRLQDDALVMTILRPRDPLGYSLRAIAWRELGRYPDAIADYEIAMAFTPQDKPEYIDLSTQRCEVFLRTGEYERVIAEAQECLKLASEETVLQYHTFCALTALGECDKASALFRQIVAGGHEARRDFREWCMKYVFDTLEAGESWHFPDSEPMGAAFLPMVEAEESYRNLSATAHRVTTDGFSARWSPDGERLAFSIGVQGYSGVAIYDPATKETDLLIVPGKDPRWSPDGQYIAFVRDCRMLRLEELAMAERENRHRPVTDEEVWLMKSDGTEPRRLAQGSWPSWASDSRQVYYLSRGDSTLCSVSLADQNAKPEKVMTCSALPSVSPDNRHLSYFEGGSLKIKDLASQDTLAECTAPAISWGVTGWSPTGNEVCLGDGNPQNEKAGLWIYDLRNREFLRVLDGQITAACWSPAATELAFCLGAPYFEIWASSLDSSIPTIEALGPGQTPDEHFHEMVAFCTRRIEADPLDAYAYSSRAHYYDCLRDRVKARADMRQWSSVLSGGLSSDVSLAAPRDLRRVIHMPFDCELVFSAERPVNTIPMMSVAFGQKGRRKMKLCEIPMFVTLLSGVCLVAGLDAPPAYADFAFSEAANLGPMINTSFGEAPDCFSPDGLELYFTSDRPGGSGRFDIWVMTRKTIDDEWGTPTNLGPQVNTAKDDALACISHDGLEFYLTSDRLGGSGGYDIWVTTRDTIDDEWDTPANLGPQVNTWANDSRAHISADGLELYFGTWNRPGGYGDSDIWVSKRTTINDPWGPPTNLGPMVNSPADENCPVLSPDGLLLFFSEDYGGPYRPGGFGNIDVWVTTRASVTDPWNPPLNLGPTVNGESLDAVPVISPDGSMLYFCSERPGGFGGLWGDIYQARIIPIVDFDGDGQVDGKELVVMIVEFGGTDALCDIGPYAWGDGVVDFEDLKVLAKYVGADFEDPTLVAHWALDESEGMVAYDSAGENDGTVRGDAGWQPDGGKVGGALEFDGLNDFVLADSPAGLGEGPFSICVWIKGGAPGRAIVSLGGGARWLYTNPIDGSLMTDLSESIRVTTPLFSDVIVTDGQWHRVVLVWDGTDRILSVDYQEAAREPLSKVSAPSGKLIIGGSASLDQESLWSGLIDDVRIYNRAVKP